MCVSYRDAYPNPRKEVAGILPSPEERGGRVGRISPEYFSPKYEWPGKGHHLDESSSQRLSMKRYILVSIAAGLLLALMDGLINANPPARELLSAYAPLARPSVDIAAGFAIDLAFGFTLAGLFLLLYPGIPGRTGILKGAGFGLIALVLPRRHAGRVNLGDVHHSSDCTPLYCHHRARGDARPGGVLRGGTKAGGSQYFR